MNFLFALLSTLTVVSGASHSAALKSAIKVYKTFDSEKFVDFVHEENGLLVSEFAALSKAHVVLKAHCEGAKDTCPKKSWRDMYGEIFASIRNEEYFEKSESDKAGTNEAFLGRAAFFRLLFPDRTVCLRDVKNKEKFQQTVEQELKQYGVSIPDLESALTFAAFALISSNIGMADGDDIYQGYLASDSKGRLRNRRGKVTKFITTYPTSSSEKVREEFSTSNNNSSARSEESDKPKRKKNLKKSSKKRREKVVDSSSEEAEENNTISKEPLERNEDENSNEVLPTRKRKRNDIGDAKHAEDHKRRKLFSVDQSNKQPFMNTSDGNQSNNGIGLSPHTVPLEIISQPNFYQQFSTLDLQASSNTTAVQNEPPISEDIQTFSLTFQKDDSSSEEHCLLDPLAETEYYGDCLLSFAYLDEALPNTNM